MCIIAISPKGTIKTSDFFLEALENSAKRNGDGMGFAYKQAHNQALYYHKGFKSVDLLIAAITNQKIRVEDELIVHFRIRTQGAISMENCHPFVLDPNNVKNIDDPGPSTTINPVMFHNGHFSGFGSVDDHSDTYNFVYELMRLRDVHNLLKIDRNKFMQTFGNLIDHNKLAFLFPKTSQPLITLGSFIEEEGYSFSNTAYKSYGTRQPANNSLPVVSRNQTSNYIENQFGTPTRKRGRFSRSREEAFVKRNIKLFEKESHYNALEHKITFNDDIYDEVIFVAKHDIMGIGVDKGSMWLMEDYNPDAAHHSIRAVANNDIAWIKLEDIEEDFNLMPKLTYSDKYSDYFRLTELITPNKSQIKKLARTYDRAYAVKKIKRQGSDKINIKYNNSVIMDVRLDALKLFLLDHEVHIPYSQYLLTT